MPTIRRLADSCLVVTDDGGATLVDPGSYTFESGEIDLDTIEDIQRVLITHEHGDHVNPGFVRWLIDRSAHITVHSNQAVADLLAPHGIEASIVAPEGVGWEDNLHEPIPTGATPPNRSWTIDGLLTHPGDSYQATVTAAVLALPLITPWGSMTASVEFAKRLAPGQVVPIHDFYTSVSGREWLNGVAGRALGAAGIELVPLDWGESYTV